MKADIDALQRNVNADLTMVRAEMALPRRDMTIKLGSMLMVSAGVILTAVRLMPHP
jgi:hypothetical protein